MTRGACTFKQRDVTRAIRAVTAAGVPVRSVDFLPNGFFRLNTGDSSSEALGDQDLDQELREFEEGHVEG